MGNSLIEQHVQSHKVLSNEQQKELIRLAQSGDIKSRDKLISSNLRFVLQVARRLTGRGVDFDELVAEGVVGMMRAIELFDLTKDVHFTTYASSWIKQKMINVIRDEGRIIKIPSLKFTQMWNYRNLQDGTISKEKSLQMTGLTKRDMDNPALWNVVSINDMTSSYDESEYDYEPSDNRYNPSDVIKGMIRNYVINIINEILDERSAFIIILRYGLNPNGYHTLSQAADILQLSKERVRQIQSKAEIKLRAEPRLREMFDDH